ncbi:MAG: M23 family metallopeptidase [Candidatus Tritonobacter lacicola]|nr:M23 family metallopeptidase [Candidatus Tritonobacter lacicola]
MYFTALLLFFIFTLAGCGRDGVEPAKRSTLPVIRFSRLPVDGPVRRPEGEFGAPRRGGEKKHQGIDLLARRGTPVRAVSPGIVVYNEMNGTLTEGYGFTLIIDHLNDYYTLYAHLDAKPPLRVGEYVKACDVIGRIGHTGNAEGLPTGIRDMLHFEVIHAPSWMLDYLGIRIVDSISPKTVTTLKAIAEGNYGYGGGALNPLDFYAGKPAYARRLF